MAGSRYQNPRITRKLQAAHHYRRPIRRAVEERAPQGRRSVFGLGLLAAIIISAVYLIFIPNFLFVKDIAVAGASGQAAQEVRQRVADYFSAGRIWPRENLFFLQPERLKADLAQNDPNLLQVSAVQRDWFHRRVAVTVIPKQPSFLLINRQAAAVLYNDGSVQQVLTSEELSQPAYQNLLKLKAGDSTELQAGQSYLDRNLADQLLALRDKFPVANRVSIDFLDFVEAPARQNVVVYTKKTASIPKNAPSDFQLILDLRPDLGDSLKRFNFMMRQFQPDRYNALYYLDLRFGDKAFLCLAGTVCVKERPADKFELAPVAVPAAATPAVTAPSPNTNTNQ